MNYLINVSVACNMADRISQRNFVLLNLFYTSYKIEVFQLFDDFKQYFKSIYFLEH